MSGISIPNDAMVHKFQTALYWGYHIVNSLVGPKVPVINLKRWCNNKLQIKWELETLNQSNAG